MVVKGKIGGAKREGEMEEREEWNAAQMDMRICLRQDGMD
jgi:hypothetical protein